MGPNRQNHLHGLHSATVQARAKCFSLFSTQAFLLTQVFAQLWYFVRPQITYCPFLCLLAALHTQPISNRPWPSSCLGPSPHPPWTPVWHQTYRRATALTWSFVFWPPWHMEKAGTAQMSTKCWWREWGMDGLGLRGSLQCCWSLVLLWPTGVINFTVVRRGNKAFQ